MKTCSVCKQTQYLENFCKNKRSKDGFHYTCKDCVREATSSEEFREKRKTRYNKKKPKRKVSESSKMTKKLYDEQYRKNNKEKIREQKKQWEILNKDNPVFKIKRNIRRRIHHALNGENKSERTMDLLGCSIDFFIDFIEKQFLDGMSWDNYGLWHLDHIKECFRFDLSNPEHQKECFHYSNHRPLWAKDNLSRRRNS